MKRRSFCVLMVLLLCMNFGVPALATENNENTFSVSLSPNILDESTSNQRAFAQQEPLEMEIALSSYEYEHNSVVNSTVQISWNGNEKWDTTLTGEAYVYNEGDNPVIVGAVRGYNNSQEVSDFIGLDYTYDVVGQKCITTVTYNYAADGSCDMMSFGKNTGELDRAIIASMNVPETASAPAVVGSGSMDDGNVLATNVDYISEYIAEVYTKRGALQYDVWTYPDMEAGHVNHIAASVKGDATAAEDYILDLQSTAYSIVPRYCEFFFACDSKGRMSTGEYLPKSKSTSFTIPLSLPLAGGQALPVNIEFTLSRMTPAATTNQTSWDAYALNGIDELDPNESAGVGFYNTFTYFGNLASGGKDRIYMQAHASIGYAYVYVVAGTGGLNNSTWYAMQSSSGRINVYN